MKKFTLIAAAVCAAFAAQAQYAVDPSNDLVKEKGPKSLDWLVLSEEAVQAFTAQGAKVQHMGPDEITRHFYVWEGTFNGATCTIPRVDFEEGDPIALEVSNVGWSGAGFAIDAPGVSTTHFTDNTRFHLAYYTPTKNAPASVAIILLDDDNKTPAKFALGDPFNDNGAIFPAIGPKANDDWQGIDISLGDLKKLYPTFNYRTVADWGGNMVAVLGGGVQGQTIALDAVYFYSTESAGLNEIGADSNNVDFVVTDNTVNVMGANGIVLYNMAGVAVKSTNGTTLGINGLPAGVYVAKAAGKTCKVVVK